MNRRTSLLLTVIAIPAFALSVTGCNDQHLEAPAGTTQADLGLQTGVGQAGAPSQQPDQLPNNGAPEGNPTNPPAIPKASN